MQKSVIKNFIKKYSLGGICESAHWYSDAKNQTLTAKAHTEDKTVILKVVLKDWQGMETCQMALPSSTKIESMLGPIGDDVVITLNRIRDRIANFTISDNDCEAVCTVAENDSFPETLDVDTDTTDLLPTEFEVEIPITEDFVSKILKSSSALSESKDFVLKNGKKGLEAVINYEDTNTNRIRFSVATIPGKDKLDSPLGFSTSVFKSIVSVNENAIGSTMKVSSRGIAIIKFETPQFISTYFLFPTRIIE